MEWLGSLGAPTNGEFEPNCIAIEPIRGSDFGQPLRFAGQICVSDLVRIGELWTDAAGHAFETAEASAATTIAGDLLVEESVSTSADEASEQRQMLRYGSVEIELIARLVVGSSYSRC